MARVGNGKGLGALGFGVTHDPATFNPADVSQTCIFLLHPLGESAKLILNVKGWVYY